MKLFKDLYQYRELLKTNIKKEIRGKYKGSFLGVLWSFMNPLLMTLVYALVFGCIMKGAKYEHYTTFLIVGILPWSWFTTCISQGTFSVLANGGIIKKVYFPREIIPISVVTSGLVNFLITCIIIALFLIFTGIGFTKYILFLPLVILAQYLLTLGILFITSSVNVYIRDFEYIINFIINLLFYGTPILYSAEIFKGHAVYKLLQLNPLRPIIDSYRDIFYWGSMPHLKSLLIVVALGVVMCIIGVLIFKKLSKGFAEEV